MSGTETLKYVLFGEDRGASDALTKFGTAAEKGSERASNALSRLSGLIGGEVGEALDKTAAGFDALGSSGSTMSGRLMGTGAAVVGLGAAMQMMASGDVAAQQQLQATVEATGKAYDGFGQDVDELIAKQEKFGNTDGDVKDALRVLTQSYQDPAAALDKMGLATDLAAAKHISLGQAAELVAKAHGGAGRLFKEFGIEVGKGADGTADYDAALAELSTRLDGQAAASVDNFSGRIGEMKTKVENVASAIAEQYGPQVTMAGTVLAGLGGAIQGFIAIKNLEILAHTRSAVATAASTTVTLVASGAQKAMAAAQWLVNAAMSANPIMLLVLAIAALVAGFIYAYNHSETFRRIVDQVWGAIKAAIGGVIDWLIAVVPQAFAWVKNAFLNYTPLGLVISHWDQIKGAVMTVVNWFRSAVPAALQAIKNAFMNYTPVGLVISHWEQINSAVSNAIASVMSYVSALPGRIISALSGLGSRACSIGTDLIQGVIDGISAMASSVANKARDVVTGAINAAKNALGIESPSRVFYEIGAFSGAGLVNALEDQHSAVAASGAGLARAAIPDTLPAFAGGSTGRGGGSVEQLVPVNIQVDGMTIVQAILKVKRQGGGMALGLA